MTGYYLSLKSKMRGHLERQQIGKQSFVGSMKHYREGNSKRGKKQVKMLGMST